MLYAASLNDTVRGGDGNDMLDGLTGGDSLYGGLGDDRLVARKFAVLMEGGDGIDTLDMTRLDAGAGVTPSFEAGLFGDGVRTTCVGVEHVVGSAFDDIILGNGGANRLEGGVGTDQLDAHGGADSLYGGVGDDNIKIRLGAAFVHGGEGRDLL